MNDAKNRVELAHEITQSDHHAPYQAKPKAREFKRAEAPKFLLQKVVEPAQTKWAASKVFASLKDESLRFRMDYRKLNAVTKRDSYPISWMDE